MVRVPFFSLAPAFIAVSSPYGLVEFESPLVHNFPIKPMVSEGAWAQRAAHLKLILSVERRPLSSGRSTSSGFVAPDSVEHGIARSPSQFWHACSVLSSPLDANVTKCCNFGK
jgi:hypothetical protein